MKVRLFILAVLLFVMWGPTAAIGASDQATGQAAPSGVATDAKPVAVMPVLKYEFEPVVDGAEILHDFPVKNTGNGLLAIQQVKTG